MDDTLVANSTLYLFCIVAFNFTLPAGMVNDHLLSPNGVTVVGVLLCAVTSIAAPSISANNIVKNLVVFIFVMFCC
jgi:hypothetical protein